MKYSDVQLTKAIKAAKKVMSERPNFNVQSALEDSDMWSKLTYQQRRRVLRELLSKGDNDVVEQ